MPKYRIDHIHLICPDIEHARAWYCEKLGGAVTFEGEFKGNKVYYVEISGFRLILIENLPGETPLPENIEVKTGLDHFGVEVESMEEALTDLKAKGVSFIQDPVEIRPGLKIAYIEAPNKVRIEVTERK